MTSVHPLQDPWEIYLRSCRSNHRPTATAGAVRFSTREIDRRSGHPADIGHPAKKKAGAVFVDLTAAFDTVWHRGLTCTLMRLPSHRHMVRIIMEMVGNRSFTLPTGNDKLSRLPCLKNFFPRTSSLRHLHLWPAIHRLQKVCIYWRPNTYACWRRPACSGRGAEQGHGNNRWKSPDMEAKAQHCKNSVGNLPP